MAPEEREQRKPRFPRPGVTTWQVSVHCDWGACGAQASSWRYSYDVQDWLPVCARHREVACAQ